MDKKYWIALSAIEQLSPCFFKALIEYFGDAEKAFNASLEDFKNIDTTLKKVSNFLEKRKCFLIFRLENRHIMDTFYM